MVYTCVDSGDPISAIRQLLRAMDCAVAADPVHGSRGFVNAYEASVEKMGREGAGKEFLRLLTLYPGEAVAYRCGSDDPLNAERLRQIADCSARFNRPVT